MKKINFSSIISFIKNLFNKTKRIEEHNKEKSVNENLEKNNFRNRFTVDGIEEKNQNLYQKINDEERMDNIIKTVNKNPEIINNFSIAKLEKINNLYDKKIEELKIKINKLKKANG